MPSSALKTTGVRKVLLRSMVAQAPKADASKLPTKTIEKPIKGAKNGGKRVVTRVDTEVLNKKTKRTTPCALRSSITPGTVLILLAGRFRGKRVVFLKQLPSGLLLVSGPYKYNSVPLQRVNQAYVIATSTKIDMTGFQLSAKLDDSLFARTEQKASKKEFLPENAMAVEKPKASAERITLQKEVDTQIINAVKKVPLLSAYLKSVFSLSKGQAPHSLKF